MKDKEFHIYRVQKGIETITEGLQDAFTVLWNEKFPGTPFTFIALEQKISSKQLLKKMPRHHSGSTIEECDIIMLAYLMVDAGVLELKKEDPVLTAAISDTRRHRNDISHRAYFACDESDFEIYIESLEKLAKALDLDKYKLPSRNKNRAEEIEKLRHMKNPKFGEELIKMEKEYIEMEFDIKLYRIREQCTTEKGELERKVIDLQEKLYEHSAEKCHYQKKLLRVNKENQILTQKLKDETTERMSLLKKINSNQLKARKLQKKLNRKRIEIYRENIKRRAVVQKLKHRNKEKEVLWQQKCKLAEEYTRLQRLTEETSRENMDLHVQIQSNIKEVKALQTEKKNLQREIQDKIKTENHLRKQVYEKDMSINVICVAFILFSKLIWISSWCSSLKTTSISLSLKTCTDQTVQLQSTVMEYNNTIEDLEKALELETEEKGKTLEEMSKIVENKTKMIKEQTETIHKQEKNLENQNNIIDQLEEKLLKTTKEQSAKIEKQTEKIKDQTNKINEQTQGIEDLTRRNNQLETDMSKIIWEKTMKIEDQDKSIDAQKERLHEQTKSMENQKRKIEEQAKINKVQTDKIMDLETEVQNLSATLTELNERSMGTLHHQKDNTKTLIYVEETEKINEDQEGELSTGYQQTKDKQSLEEFNVGQYGNISYNENDNELRVEKVNDLRVYFVDCKATSIHLNT